MGTLKVDTIQDSGGNTILSSDGSGGFSNSLPAGKTSNFRNFIINGDMSIAQRGTSSSGATSDTYYTCDRWRIRIGALGTWTISQSTDIPTGQGFSKSLKIDCTTADASPSASDYFFVAQKIEGQMLQHLKKGTSNAESVTLSFWVKCNKTGNGQVNIRDVDNDRIIGNTYTINSANTWEKKTITFAGDTTGTLDNDNNASFDLNFWLDSGSDYIGGSVPTSWEARAQTDRNAGGTLSLGDNTANEWYITGVQLEVGTTASDFEFLPHDVNFQRCARYFQQTRETSDRLSFSGKANGDTTIDFGFPLVVPLRNTPTASQSGTEWRAWRPTSNLAQSSATFTVQAWVENNPWVALRVGSFPSSSFTNNYLVGIGPSNLYINLDAEL